MRTIIENGRIYDGSGQTPYKKNIIVEDDKILDITNEKCEEVDQRIDADGLVVTPGFIDTHRHSDIAALYDPNFGKLEVAQGLSTIIGGNCGLSPVPSSARYKNELFDFIEPTLGRAPGVMKEESLEEYFHTLEQRDKILNVGNFVALGAVKTAIKGYSRAPFTDREMDQCQKIIEEGLRAGAVGISTGIMYQPECFNEKKEMIQLLSAGTPFGRTIVSHIRGEGDSLVESVEEMIELAQITKLPLNISHFKATGIKNWGSTIYKAIEKIEMARNKGQDITVDFYPYLGGSTTLLSLLPPTLLEDSLETTLRALDGAKGLERIKSEIYKEHDGWDNMVTSIGWDRIIISSATQMDMVGKSMEEVTKNYKYSDPAQLLHQLVIEEKGKVTIILMSMSQADVDTVARLPYSMVISDGLYGASESPHPRLYGAFPKIIREFVNERHILSMEEAIKKMTSMPAERLMLNKRGYLKPGYYADINIFSPDNIKDHATFNQPKQLSTGMYYTMVNGQRVIEKDHIISGAQGRVLYL